MREFGEKLHADLRHGFADFLPARSILGPRRPAPIAPWALPSEAASEKPCSDAASTSGSVDVHDFCFTKNSAAVIADAAAPESKQEASPASMPFWMRTLFILLAAAWMGAVAGVAYQRLLVSSVAAKASEVKPLQPVRHAEAETRQLRRRPSADPLVRGGAGPP